MSIQFNIMPVDPLSEAKRKDLEGMDSLEIHERNRDEIEDIFKLETLKIREETLKKQRDSDSDSKKKEQRDSDSDSKKREESESEKVESDLEEIFHLETSINARLETLTRGSETMRRMREEGSETLRRMKSDGMETMRRKKEEDNDSERETETMKRVGSDKKKRYEQWEREVPTRKSCEGSVRKTSGLQDTLYSGFTRASTLQSSLKRRSRRGREGECFVLSLTFFGFSAFLVLQFPHFVESVFTNHNLRGLSFD